MKIVFIINAIHMQRCMKRIDEFAERGYDVEAYGFDRGVDMMKRPQACDVHVIGKIDTAKSYIQRSQTIYNGIKTVVKKTKPQNPVYYLFGLDMAMVFRLVTRAAYIYEESDLVHTYMSSKMAIRFLEGIDKKIIHHSVLSVFTSEGFINYHFGDIIPDNTIVVANKLPVTVSKLERIEKKTDGKNLSIGFVGFIRFKSVLNFARVFCSSFPDAKFHFYGTTNIESDRLLFEPLKQVENCIFHGQFRYPDDLPAIYSSLDVVVATYDVEFQNVKYAEPNKIYESIYFDTPIVVSKGTFLAKKVDRMEIGYSIDALNDKEVVDFVKGLTVNEIRGKVEKIRRIDKSITLNINDSLFAKLKELGVS